jgi:hypothetical protein
MLIEMMAYLGVLLAVLGLGFAAMYQCAKSSKALRQNTHDVARAIEAGEQWRTDVRNSRESVRLETTHDGRVLHLPRSARDEVAYLFSTNAVFRRAGHGPWTSVLDNVQASTVAADRRQRVTAWQWDLELQTRIRKRPASVRPLFTFVAVPAGNSAP